MSATPFWKKINQTVCGYSRTITDDIVGEILQLSKNDIVQGFLKYKPYTRESYDNFLKTSTCSTYMNEFIHELSQELNLETNIAYLVMCNYLMFEYYGKIKEFWQITKFGTTIKLKESIWNFYTAERMFMLKTLRYIFEFVDDREHEFNRQYDEFLATIKIREFQTNLIKQFEMVMNEINPKNANLEDPRFDNWLCRNIREQTELLMIIMLSADYNNFKPDQLTELLKLFYLHNFSTQPPLFECTKVAGAQDLQELLTAEVGCFFALLRNYWDEEELKDLWKNPELLDLDNNLLHLHVRAGHSIVLLAWLTLRAKAIKKIEEDTFVDVMSKKPFKFLHSVLSNVIFKNCRAGKIVFMAVHKMMDEFCLMYSDRKQLYEEEGLVHVLNELLTVKEIAEVCLQARNGLDSMVELALETFPYDFFGFAGMCRSLLGLEEHRQQALELLQNVPSFLSDVTWAVPRKDICVLPRNTRVFSDSELVVFPAHTTVRAYPMFGQNLLQYKGTYNFFSFFEYLINGLIEDATQLHNFDDHMVQKVIYGYTIVVQMIKCCQDHRLDELGIQNVIDKLDKILVRLEGDLLRSELVEVYFDVNIALLTHRRVKFFEKCPEIIWKIFFPRIRAEYVGNPVEKLLFNQYVFDETIFMRLFFDEEFKDNHTLLLHYIHILYRIIQAQFHYKNFQLSGVTYLLNFVFLQHLTWRYKDENQKSKIALGCINIFHYILQKDPKDLDNNERKIFDLCHHAFLNNPFVIDTFTRMFIKEKYHLIFIMERESNWVKGPVLDTMQCIRMQLAFLLLIMKHKKELGTGCLLDNKLAFIVKPVASYFTNSYSPVIAELSCRFLERLAQDRYVPLLALLELDHYQVQSLFLERLRDPLEEENVKIAIIDLINTCVANQNGMTAAFFNLKCFMYWDGMQSDLFSGDTVSDFMVDYLQNIKKSHEYFRSPLQLGILRLLNNLWVNHRENLIDNIANLKDFWPVMIDPFFCDFVQEVEVYTAILRVINLEINTNVEKVEPKLIAVIKQFLENTEQLDSWIEFVLETVKDPLEKNKELLSAWMEFLVSTKKVTPESFEPEAREKVIIACLSGLTTPSKSPDNLEIVYLWAQLYLMLISTWPIYDDQEEDILEKLSLFLHSMQPVYKFLPSKLKETIWCTINRTILDLRQYFSDNTSVLVTFLQPVGLLIDLEYEYLNIGVWHAKDSFEKVKLLKSWLIIIFIGNSLMELDNVAELSLWLDYRDFLQRVMNSVGHMVQDRATLPFAKLAIDHLITYAQSPLSNDFCIVDLFGFFYSVRPPCLTISVGEAILGGLPVNLKEWWLIFTTLIRLNRILINNLGGAMLSVCISFLSNHDQPLQEIICLTQYTVDMTALTLVCETLKFIYTLLYWRKNWYAEAPRSLELIIDGIKTTINACILSVLGSKKINFYKIIHGKDLDVLDSAPADLLVSVLNKLMEIIYWASSCLQKTRPSLVELLYTKVPNENLTLLVNNDFSVPRFELPITSTLTYGKLLCLVHYLCKTFNQLSPGTPTVTRINRQVSLRDVHEQIRMKSLGKIFEHCTATYEKCIGFMVYMQRSDDLPNEKLSSFLHYDTTEFSGSSRAVSQLDYHLVKNALEALMTFLAGEVWYTSMSLDQEQLFSYKRELGSEIQFFYEFVRKRTSELYHSMVTSPKSAMLNIQTDSDVIQRYMVSKMQEGTIREVAENNFLLVVSQWLVKICELAN